MNKWEKYFMDVAIRTSELSYAQRLKVGCVAVLDRRIICCGFNGTAPGEDNCCEEPIELTTIMPYELSDRMEWISGKTFIWKTKGNVLHAEENMILFAKEFGISLSDCTLYVTHSPCINCAKLITTETNITKIIYNTKYRSSEGIEFLENSGIKVFQLNQL